MDSYLSDFNQYFDFDQAALAGFEQDEDENAALAAQLQHYITSPNQVLSSNPELTCPSMMLIDVCAPGEDASSSLLEQDTLTSFADFSSWMPRYSKPATACENCRGKRLECYFTYEHQTACSPCESLFKPCSFRTGKDVDASRTHGSGNRVNTLHSVTENVAQPNGAQTALRPLFASGASMDDVLEDQFERQPDKRGYRFSRVTVQILKSWLNEHADNPNPSELEKDELQEQTGLTRVQISNWFANARRRCKARPKRCTSPSIRSSRSKPINISNSERLAEMTPLDRWKESPPESEPASMTAIARAVATTDYSRQASETSSQAHSFNGQRRGSSTGSGLSALEPRSTSSLDTGRSEGSQASYGSAWSHSSDRGSFTSFARRRNRRRHRVSRTPGSTLSGSQATKRPFQCTFCTATFLHKYDWVRHEKSIHVSLEKWICAPLGPVVALSADGTTQCVFCELINPSQEHINSHQHSECREKGPAARTFARKDHLRQHLKLVHNVPLTASMESWKWSPPYVRSCCGFCSPDKPVIFTSWQDRVDHLAKHFREGSQMSQWTGDWGFEPCIAQTVANAIPPFLIGQEARAPDPFNAEPEIPYLLGETDPEGDLPPGPNKPHLCWQILTLGLGKFVKNQQDLGNIVTDELLQQQARIIVFGNDDGWNQTAADDRHWLTHFKQAHGLMEMNLPDSIAASSNLALTSGFPQAPQFQQENLMHSIQGMPPFDETFQFEH